jgi:hypothetical protein
MSRYPDTPDGIAAANLWTAVERELGLILSDAAVSGCLVTGQQLTAAYLVAQRLVRERDAEEELIALTRRTGRDYELRRIEGRERCRAPWRSYVVDIVGEPSAVAYGETPAEAVRQAQLLELT